MDKKQSTPVMQQFWGIKEKYPDSIILFRMGDFYETFEKDAEITSDVLGIALTKRANGAAASVPLAGFPYHALEQYLFIALPIVEIIFVLVSSKSSLDIPGNLGMPAVIITTSEFFRDE